MSERTGFFWDFIEGRVDPPPAAATLGWELVDIAPDEGTIALRFEAGPHLLNPAGTVQGGFLAAMLDDTLGPALIATLEAGQFAPTLDLHVQYIRPAQVGPIHSTGRVVHRTRTIAFLSGELRSPQGALLATATATVRIQAPPRQPSSDLSVAAGPESTDTQP